MGTTPYLGPWLARPYLLAKHFIVQLQLVQALQLLGEAVVALPQLLDVVASLGQDPPFTLQEPQL